MDKTSWTVVVVCLILLIGYQPLINYLYPPVPVAPKAAGAAAAPAIPATAAPSVAAPASAGSASPVIAPQEGAFFKESNLPKEEVLVLKNDFIEARLTTHGGAVSQVSLLKHKADHGEPVIINRGVEEPILNLVGWTESKQVIPYIIEASSGQSATFVAELAPGLLLRRKYTLGENYLITLEQSLENRQTTVASLKPYRLQVGACGPVHLRQEERTYIGGAWYSDKESFHTSKIMEYDNGRFLGFLWETHGKAFVESDPKDRILWGVSESQFFISALRPVTDAGLKVDLRKLQLPAFKQEDGWIPDSLQVRVVMPGFDVPAGQTVSKSFELYAGPKQYKILSDMGHGMNRIMGFGWFEWLSGFLLDAMRFINKFIGNYGATIILLTILIKAVLWYPQTQANKNMRQMQLIAPLLKEVQEKYKENPTKLQEEMMKLYKDYGVNPLGGCLPMLIQMPIFIGFYLMLQSAIEMRHEHFLWIADLSQPDTIYRLPIPGLHFPINLMPLLMTATMYWSMNITPQTQGVDNPGMKVMKFMPLIMLVFCYNFSSALSLYWTMQNLIGVGQMYYNLHQPMPKLEKVTAPGAKRKKN